MRRTWWFSSLLDRAYLIQNRTAYTIILCLGGKWYEYLGAKSKLLLLLMKNWFNMILIYLINYWMKWDMPNVITAFWLLYLRLKWLVDWFAVTVWKIGTLRILWTFKCLNSLDFRYSSWMEWTVWTSLSMVWICMAHFQNQWFRFLLLCCSFRWALMSS